MSNVVELSRAGSLADLEVALEVVDIQRLFLLAQWDLEALEVLLLVDQVVSEVVFVEALMADGDEGVSGEVSKTVEVMVEVEEALDIREAGVSRAGVGMEEIVVGMVEQMAMALPQMLQLVREVVEVVLVVDTAEEDMVLALQIETVLRQAVGMIRAVADAHMMTEAVVIVAVIAAMEIAMEHPVVEAAAIWSR